MWRVKFSDLKSDDISEGNLSTIFSARPTWCALTVPRPHTRLGVYFAGQNGPDRAPATVIIFSRSKVAWEHGVFTACGYDRFIDPHNSTVRRRCLGSANDTEGGIVVGGMGVVAEGEIERRNQSTRDRRTASWTPSNHGLSWDICAIEVDCETQIRRAQSAESR